jgi:predicted RNA binding protein YcfA (HicA-like mRNA interferase family)
MKREELLRTLRETAKGHGLHFYLQRQGGDHEIWQFGEMQVSVPRHRDIKIGTARRIIKSCIREAERQND